MRTIDDLTRHTSNSFVNKVIDFLKELYFDDMPYLCEKYDIVMERDSDIQVFYHIWNTWDNERKNNFVKKFDNVTIKDLDNLYDLLAKLKFS